MRRELVIVRRRLLVQHRFDLIQTVLPAYYARTRLESHLDAILVAGRARFGHLELKAGDAQKRGAGIEQQEILRIPDQRIQQKLFLGH